MTIINHLPLPGQRGNPAVDNLSPDELATILREQPEVDRKRRALLKILIGLPFGLSIWRKFYGHHQERRKFLMNIFSVAGYRFHEGPRVERRLKPGQIVHLIPEPDNPHDEFAVEIKTAEGAKLGYVPRQDNRAISRLLRSGMLLLGRVEQIHPELPPWQRVRVSVWLVV